MPSWETVSFSSPSSHFCCGLLGNHKALKQCWNNQTINWSVYWQKNASKRAKCQIWFHFEHSAVMHSHLELSQSLAKLIEDLWNKTKTEMCPQWPEPGNLFKNPFTLSRNTDIGAHTLFFFGRVVMWTAGFCCSQQSGLSCMSGVVLASPPLLWKRLNKQAGTQDNAARSSQPHLWGQGGFSFPWDSTDGSFIRLMKVTVDS